MRTVSIFAVLGALVGAAVFGLLDATGHIAHGTRVFGWVTFGEPRRYADYAPLPQPTAWWVLLLLAVGVGLLAGALLGTAATLAGVRIDRRSP